MVLRDVAVATNFWTQFDSNGFVGYNFGCMIVSGNLVTCCLIIGVGFRGQSI